MEHLVSIVVPVYNAERYLCTSIHALQKQDYSNIEIILVDDGSKMRLRLFAIRLKKEDKRIGLYIRQMEELVLREMQV